MSLCARGEVRCVALQTDVRKAFFRRHWTHQPFSLPFAICLHQDTRPRRAGGPKSYKDTPEIILYPNDSMEEEAAAVATSEEEVLMEGDIDEDDEGVAALRARPRRLKHAASRSSLEVGAPPVKGVVRTSSRSNKFIRSMAEAPPSFTDLFAEKSDTSECNDDERKPRARDAAAPCKRPPSPLKSPARRHAQRRHSLLTETLAAAHGAGVGDDDDDDSLADDDEADDTNDDEPLKIQRILASRTETKKKWREICQPKNTSEIHYGSRWFQTGDGSADKVACEDETAFEERFLVKWADLSFLHTSWETQHDLVDQLEAKSYMSTFFRKAVNGLLYSQDERCDGDYFDPAFTEIERILEVQLPDYGDDNSKLSAETEDRCDAKSFGMIMDKTDPDFDKGTGRQFLVKWCNTPYSESTYEFERDLIMNEIEYKEHVKLFLRRNMKPTKTERRAYLKQGENEYKRMYKIFGDKSTLNEADREKAVEEYKKKLQETVYKNGGELRDYQAEGVAWMLANFVNRRSSILADEMGLGKVRKRQNCCSLPF